MAQSITLTTREVFEMFCVMANLDEQAPALQAPGVDRGMLLSLVYRARAARQYQDETGDISIDFSVSKY